MPAGRRLPRGAGGCMAGGAVARALGPVPARRSGLRARVLRRCVGGSTSVTADLFSLGGRVAVVTGGAGQLGTEIARGLADQGARVAVFDIAAEDGGDEIRTYGVGGTDRGAVERAARQGP